MDAQDGDEPVDDPAAALAELARLRSRARRDVRGWWFPLVLFGALVLLAAPLYWDVPPEDGSLTGSFDVALVRAFGGVFTAHPLAIAVYWLVALVAGFAGSGFWYRRHARQVGLRRPVLAFVLTGLAVTLVLLAAQEAPFLSYLLFFVSVRGTSSIAVIAVSLFVLARLERSRALLAFAVGFLGVAVLVSTYDVENLVVGAGVPFGAWTTATPVLVPGLVLLAGGLAARPAAALRVQPVPRVTHATRSMSEVVHQRHRLGILTVAREVDQVEFAYLRDTLDLTAGNLSRHLAVLEESGLVAIEKGYAGRRPRTWVRLTPRGRAALDEELRLLRRLLDGGAPA